MEHSSQDLANPTLLYSIPSLGLDDSKGPPSLVFVTYELPLHEFPYSFPEDAGFFVSNGWLGRPGSYQQRIELSDPQGELIAETGNREIVLVDDMPYMAITYLMGLTFASAGRHRVKVFLNDQEILSYPLSLVLQGPE